MARTDFRAAAARRLSEDTELSPAIVSLLTPDSPTRSIGVRIVHIDHIEPNPEQPRMVFEPQALEELASSIREHGVLQPILVRPLGPNTYQIVAGERRWRASRLAGLENIPALIEEIDDDTALEIAIIENLQREDLTPLDEAAMYDRMIHEHGYSIRKLADKLGKDKGYLENRLRLADAPPEIRELVSLRKDSLSHAYELMKVEDPKKRRRLAEQVARGELTLIKLRDKIEGRRTRAVRADAEAVAAVDDAISESIADEAEETDALWTSDDSEPARPLSEDSLVNAKQSLVDAVDELVGVLRQRRGPRFDRRHRPREPGEVPDDRQASPRERHRPGPERRRRVLIRALPGQRHARQPGGGEERRPRRPRVPMRAPGGPGHRTDPGPRPATMMPVAAVAAANAPVPASPASKVTAAAATTTASRPALTRHDHWSPSRCRRPTPFRPPDHVLRPPARWRPPVPRRRGRPQG